jgi:hypothetical protein
VESTTGIIPESLMYPEKKAEVISFLISQPLPSWTKRKLLVGWAVTVGVFLGAIDYHQVVASGTDNPLPIGVRK